MCSLDVFMSVCVSVCAQSDQFKMVKATDFKFGTHVPSDSPDSGT